MSNPSLHFDKICWENVHIAVLCDRKDLNMSFHTLSRALGYDRAGEKVLVSWQECQKAYNEVTDTTKPNRHPTLAIYEKMTENRKTFWNKVVKEGLRRAEYTEVMIELRDAKMSKPDKNLKRAELKEEERSTRRKQWSDAVPGK